MWNKTRLLLKGRMSTTGNCLVQEIYSSPLDALQPQSEEQEPIYQTIDEAKYHRRSIKFDPPSSAHASLSTSSSPKNELSSNVFDTFFTCFFGQVSQLMISKFLKGIYWCVLKLCQRSIRAIPCCQAFVKWLSYHDLSRKLLSLKFCSLQRQKDFVGFSISLGIFCNVLPRSKGQVNVCIY